MIHHILNQRVKGANICPLSDVAQKFSVDHFKVKRLDESFSISPILNIAVPTTLGTNLFVKEVKVSPQGGDVLLELIPNNQIIMILYALVVLMGMRESFYSSGIISADVMLATSLIFISFLFANLLLFKRSVLKKIQREKIS